ncbi:MAG: hypothetical protein IJ026_05395 [Candidatus Methanomethylophilaceae archaeon]|nr:hypothetical protein [Candidatus Methanomethylophilaceae archaeon]
MNPFYMRLPRNRPEFVLFMVIVSLLSVNTIAPIITFMETEVSWETYVHVLSILPILWPTVIATVLITYRPAGYLTSRVTSQGDSFRSCVTINILCTVFLMSIILTVVGAWIGNGAITTEPLEMFLYRWPRNFGIALGIEMLFAQPIARWVLEKYHIRADSRQIGG